ncbi:hypothetical protein BKA69DRAFT_1123740 [Paraphysoderma sedebokerense]|nr:hypothetical protein BKA69DRAFT_1123740 [Paraphysoderma sedebokerense]
MESEGRICLCVIGYPLQIPLIILFLAQLAMIHGAPVESEAAVSVNEDHEDGIAVDFEGMSGSEHDNRLGKRQLRNVGRAGTVSPTPVKTTVDALTSASNFGRTGRGLGLFLGVKVQ